jgi:tRNA(Ile2) C34 agmatinyltransferase TiaS
MNVQCQVCRYTYTVAGSAGVLTEVRCPRCSVKARLIQVPMGRSVNGRDEQPGLPPNAEMHAMSTADSIAASR